MRIWFLARCRTNSHCNRRSVKSHTTIMWPHNGDVVMCYKDIPNPALSNRSESLELWNGDCFEVLFHLRVRIMTFRQDGSAIRVLALWFEPHLQVFPILKLNRVYILLAWFARFAVNFYIICHFRYLFKGQHLRNWSQLISYADMRVCRNKGWKICSTGIHTSFNSILCYSTLLRSINAYLYNAQDNYFCKDKRFRCSA